MFRTPVLLLLFFSGAAALGYEVTWARSLGLVFGASHLAVTTVLAVFMGGQAMGSALFGTRADRTDRPLRLYGMLEVGIGFSAVAFLVLMRWYPSIYGPLARWAEGNHVYLTLMRTTFAVAAIIVPTTLMGGTLPVITRFAVRRGEGVARNLSVLYAFNTLGAVVGALAAGFVLLKLLGVTVTLLVSAMTSIAVGFSAIFLDGRAEVTEPSNAPDHPDVLRGFQEEEVVDDPARRLVLLGIGISGFCALGYEVLWTRMLTLVMGTSVYSFTIMLVAFLTGIAAGSHSFGLVHLFSGPRAGGRGKVILFGGTQMAIGLSALATTIMMRDLPMIANRLQALLTGASAEEFTGRLVASTMVAFAYMFVPAFLMGFAFPAAGAVTATGPSDAGGTVGRLLSTNTVGAIAGSVASGFVLIYLFGIERSLQMLVVVNVAAGLAIATCMFARRRMPWLFAAAATALLIALGAFPNWGRVWDRNYFAAYINNERSFDNPDGVRAQMANIDILYHYEGVNETASVTHRKGGVQTFIVNGRPEASTFMVDIQLQKLLGHLPMLLHRNPRKVFVLGLGSGMTAGAISIHPEVERLVLGEIEKGILGVARTFGRWNNHVLDNPKLEVVFNDGRNLLATTQEKFDVVSADPIHPWSGGAGYLYTKEYFRNVADRLAAGGIVCQWLPMYELSVRDVKTIVRTFADIFPHTMVWKTYYDAILVGSGVPIVIDEAILTRRMSVPAIREDLAPIHIATADDLLSFFLAGTSGTRAFGRDGDINTDDNLILEFTAPVSQGVSGLEARNALAFSEYRENLFPHLATQPRLDPEYRRDHWNRRMETGRLFDQAHAQFLKARRSPRSSQLLSFLQARDPDYAPLRFLLDWADYLKRTDPALIGEAVFAVRTAQGTITTLRVSAMRQFLGRERVLVSFLDNTRREIYGQRYIDGPYERLDALVATYVEQTLTSLRTAAGRIPPGSPMEIPLEGDMVAALRAETTRTVGRLPHSRR